MLHSQIWVCEIDIFIQIRKTFTNVHTYTEIRKTRNWFRYETFIYLFEFKVFWRAERERHNFFNKRTAHFVNPNCSRFSESKKRLRSSRLESQLTRSGFKYQLTVFFFKFQNPQRFRAWRHSPPRSYFLSGFFIVTSLIVTFTCTQCVYLTNPCTKRKVLSLTKTKGKIYKTKSLRNYITGWEENSM